MKLSKEALVALQQMMGEEGSIFNRNLFLRHWTGYPGPEKCSIFPDKIVDIATFEELKKTGSITSHIADEYWRLSGIGLKALKDAGMETKPGKLTRDDIEWLTGTGRYAQ
ncbi:MAG: hypothetical protein A3B91_01160 [Candidatus Yanofskybacteria bacterium RIFCSPHIGHO2_02_FULL_41_29]|uniref:Uncharacterized protein n=1 Tax=Candidatus Yanofskybacteria bacterium RIFCSPHIGHO2_01_FULL_41_53 TaxID=1802663 RepID=A0A1F8EGH9_9BACT|nr:MAG: hypothetical protein A2650_01405 [Candidatus Yanofskybacteria bacterium RIFCSPHIGHO2_01_FULL_41_53]OGN11371.1 MAG: hypothetical protein A3B91_01160 [Candidatus Yanofskybacteria bacterium RIFCSPHIGHO2_02_FULL_41_29]OGN17741.1 MAG: hypothetical protein A3F48_00705 [Candidatus Yanofskybacteria bacterium RIFCSPHIGHO2_12_FULL_41_9]OGN24741.1 MAG: hypothetical protein A2916_01760 [Candidatus Yanofskybacteria bacterium RIFCSPLOWO2_01_FULL_41_67]OGN28938.1 MAG: hypothetical protein A3H54_02230 